ncbi:copper chaperone PCu(A)C [Paraburkholderia sp. RP-4-7]|uniref:Copper chaperone PCu(A)C n=1 Tax=Paraburkholderia polaris TaxID=2728848 RepID=A0A848INN7_9BURK|nr:copper chaperone PCu(A)C [Paraburkholderia polaris]NMM03391.1 copper chaperone PCu(A)C [Paraburkholderia polaris]
MDADRMTEMLAVARLNIPAHARIDLKPSGIHVMFFDLKNSLTYKSTIPMTLSFQKARAIYVIVTVEKAGAMTFGDMDGMKTLMCLLAIAQLVVAHPNSARRRWLRLSRGIASSEALVTHRTAKIYGDVL